MQKNKFLSESEINEFIAFCDRNNLTYEKVGKFCYLHEKSMSRAILKKKLQRAYAELAIRKAEEEARKKFEVTFIERVM